MIVVRACSTPEETRLLKAALADFSRDGARAAYVSWLFARGDDARARAVQATIEAFQTLDARALNELSVDACWGRMIAIPLLTAFVRARADYDADDLMRLRDLVFPQIRAAVSLSYSPCVAEPPIGASYLWGLPDMPDGDAWPKVGELSDLSGAKKKLPQDLHAAFLGQIAFSDMRGTAFAEDLPSEGGFAIFAITEVAKLGIVETLIRPWDNKAVLSRRAAPPDLIEDRLGDMTNAPQPACRIELEESLSLPDATWGPFAQMIPGCAYDEPYHDLYRLLIDACGDKLLGFGGYLRGSSGADPSPDTSHLRLAVLRDTPDAGLVHFAIPGADLIRGRLDAVKYVWNDWDS